ncbi:MAG: site-2 protease family protein [Phycisphaeraceae bacterium]|nr:site-2 protease family protein [Phycisphaeraceae bacterium]
MVEPQFYQLNSRMIPLRDILPGAANLYQRCLLLVLWPLWKFFRVNTPITTEAINAPELGPFRVPASDFAPARQEGLAELDEAARRLGYEPVAWYQAHDRQTATEFYVVLYRSADARAIALAKQRVWKYIHPPRVDTELALVSRDPSGGLVRSGTTGPDLSRVLGVTTHVMRGATFEDLDTAHRSKASATGYDRLDHDDRALELHEALHAMDRDANLAQGIYTEPDPGLVIVEDLSAASYTTGGAYGTVALPAAFEASDNAPILRALVHLEQKKWSLSSLLILLAVSVGLFVAGGWAVWDLSLVLMLVGILFVHELGHLLAMKLFGYQNVKMFFIPLMGAAVSGRAVDVAGWRKLVVYLAGPLPGIALGLAALAGAVLNEQDWLYQIALLTIVLNALNLLPILPLDGGRVIDTTLTSRHPMADLIFRVLTVFVLLVLFLILQDKILLFLGIFMAIGIAPSYKIAKVAIGLRQGPRLPDPEADQCVPLAAADLIATRVKEVLPKSLSAKAAAQYVQMIYERVMSKPPGLLATTLALLVQFGAFFGSVAGIILILAVGPYGYWGQDYIEEPLAHAYDPQDRGDWPADTAAVHRDSLITLVVACADADQSERIAGRLAQQAAGEAGLLRLGPVLLIDLDGASPLRASWIDQLESEAEMVLVQTSDVTVRFNVSAVAGDEPQAEALAQSFSTLLPLGQNHTMVPPWHPDPSRFEPFEDARRTYALVAGFTLDDPVYDEERAEREQRLSAKHQAAIKRGDPELIRSTEEDLNQYRAERYGDEIDLAAAQFGDSLDPAVVQALRDRPQYVWNEQATDANYEAFGKQLDQWHIGLGRLLGASSVDDPYRGASLLGGYFYSGGEQVWMRDLVLDHPTLGLPMMLDWLIKQGYGEVRFEPIDPLQGTDFLGE